MVPMMVIHDQVPYVMPCLVTNYGKQSYHLFLGEKPDDESTLYRLQDGQIVYVQEMKVLPPKLVPFDIKGDMVKNLTGDAFFALKVFALKSKFFQLSDAAMQTHGEKQRDMWYKVIGLMEPIFAGGWM